MRVFLDLPGLDLPVDLEAEGPPPWSNVVMQAGGSLSPDTASFHETKDAIRKWLPTLEAISLDSLREQIVDESEIELPDGCGVVQSLWDEIKRFEREEVPTREPNSLQACILSALVASQKGDPHELALAHAYDEARRSSLGFQFDLLVKSLTGKCSSEVSIDELAAHYARPRQTNQPSNRAIPIPFARHPYHPVCPVKSHFPGSLHSAPWLIGNPQPLSPPDAVRFWLARNWVNPHSPFWLMERPAIVEILNFFDLIERGSTYASSNVREAIRHDLVNLHPQPVKSVVMPESTSVHGRMVRIGGNCDSACFERLRLTKTLLRSVQKVDSHGLFSDRFTSK
jgi:hypothetical protein